LEADLKAQTHPEEEVKVHLEEGLKAQAYQEKEVKTHLEEGLKAPAHLEEAVQAPLRNMVEALLDLAEKEEMLSLPGEGDLTQVDQMEEIREAQLDQEEAALVEKVEAPNLEEAIVEVGMEAPDLEAEVDNNREDLVEEIKILEEKVSKQWIGKLLELQMAGKVFLIFYQNKVNSL